MAGQTIETEHVFERVDLGETVAPYVLLEPLKAVLPLAKATGDIKLEDGWYGIDPLTLGERMRRRWRVISELWDEYKGANNRGLLGNVDRQHPASRG